MSKILPDITGQRFGRLTVVRFVGIDARKYKSYLCLCDCGKELTAAGARVRSGDIRSCGCLLNEARQVNLHKACLAQTKHGLSGTLIYQTWAAMMQRCYRFEHEMFRYYGAKGVSVCNWLRMSPQNLLKLLGDRPERGHSIDRKDGAGHYSCGQCNHCEKMGWPLNVQWSTAKQQARNRKNNIWITIDGETKLCSDWAKIMGKRFNWVRRRYTDYKD